MTNEIKEFCKWYGSEVANGLVDMKYITGGCIGEDTTRHAFCAENNNVNKIIKSGKIVSRLDVF